MGKNICKRTLSSLLAIIMIVTTFCFADLGLHASAVVKVSEGSEMRPAMQFYVPETIYLNPNGSNYQYFVDETMSGGLNKSPAQTLGHVYVTSPVTVKEMKLSKRVGTGSYTEVKSVASGLTLSYELNQSMTGSGNTVIEWKLDFKFKGTNYECYAYTYVYAPNVQQNGTILHQQHGNPETVFSFFVTGFHSQSGGTKQSKMIGANATAVTNKLAAPLYSFTEESVPSGYSVWSGTTYYGSGTGFDSYENTDVGDVIYPDPDNSGTTNAKATITIDTSRYNNYNQIPNLSVGYAQYYHYREGSGNFIYWIASLNSSNVDYRSSDDKDA